jgi:hypothetical protein
MTGKDSKNWISSATLIWWRDSTHIFMKSQLKLLDPIWKRVVQDLTQDLKR